jgi:hypothetical protein
MNITTVLGSGGTLTLINFARKHAEKLAAHPDPEIRDRSQAVLAAIDSLEQAYTARRPLASLWSAAATAKDDADDRLDGFVSALSYELLGPGLLKGDRSAPAYRGLFPAGNISFVNGPDRAELAHVAGMVAFLHGNPGHPLAGRATELAALAAELDAALPAVASAEAALRAAQAVEREHRDALKRALRKSVTFLRYHLDRDEKKVDALFPSIAEAKVTEDEAPAI